MQGSPHEQLLEYRRERALEGIHHVPPHLRERFMGGVLLDAARSEMEENQDQLVETPAQLQELYPVSPEAAEGILNHRQQIMDILNGTDDRLLIIEGPCSLDSNKLTDDVPASLRAAEIIHDFSLRDEIQKSAKIVGRFPPRKPRTNTGHAGLQQKNRNHAHSLISNIANSGLGLAIEIMHDYDFAFYKPYLSLGWIGARDSGSTLLRHQASNNPDLPLLFKNGEDGTLDQALNAIMTAKERHSVEYPDHHLALRTRTSEGNPNTGIIIRGGDTVRSPDDLTATLKRAEQAETPYLLDCAHGIGAIFDPKVKKSVKGQLGALDFIIEHVRRMPPKQMKYFRGIMVEAYLVSGKYGDIRVPGQSATDPCITLDDAHAKIHQLLEARGESYN